MNDRQRRRFDALVAEVIDDLPTAFAEFIEHVPVVVLDLPEPHMLDDLERDHGERIPANELCGLHTGVADTERSVHDTGELPSCVHLFRVGIVAAAGGWASEDADDRIAEQIAITLLHEIGHQLGLDEDDLDALGYG